MRTYWVYILTSNTGTIYVGVTNNLERRVYEHKSKLVPGFTSKYNITRLVYFSEFSHIDQAIEFEKRIKKWSRVKKIGLIREFNPLFTDLAESADLSQGSR